MHFEAIVTGLGGVGSAALWRIARRGRRVLGIDQFAPPHDRGSSHGQTRIIRKAYFEHPDYVPLAIRSYELWDDLAKGSGNPVRVTTGLAQFGPANGVVVPGVLEAARQHGLAVESLAPATVRARWPAFAADDLAGVYERDAGVLFVERCVEAQIAAARACGAEVLTNAEVVGWDAGSVITVRTTAGVFTADRLIVAAGPWATNLLPASVPPLVVRRKTVHWFADPPPCHVSTGLPCYLFELPTGVFYGFPLMDERGIKVGEHTGGAVVADASAVDRTLLPSDEAPVIEFLRQRLPTVERTSGAHSVCMYTMSPDEQFIIDRLPDEPRIAIAAGLSGHGFKFAPVLGEGLADLAFAGTTALPIDFLSLRRFAKGA